MRPKCPVCGKLFWCDYPNQWRYKREKTFLCSWGCLRKYDNGKEAKPKMEAVILTEEQRNEALRLALNDVNPLPYLKECGCKNTTTSWRSILNWAKENCSKEIYESLPQSFRKKKQEEKKEETEIQLTISSEELKKTERLPVAALYSRVLHGTYKRITMNDKPAMMLTGLGYEIMLTMEKWDMLAEEIRTAAEQLGEKEV